MMQLGHRQQFAARATGQYFLAAAEDQYAVVARLRRRLLPENASEAIVAAEFADPAGGPTAPLPGPPSSDAQMPDAPPQRPRRLPNVFHACGPLRGPRQALGTDRAVEAAARVALSLAQHRTQLPKPAHFTVVLALVSRGRGGDRLAPSAANVVHIAFAKDSSSAGVPVITPGCPLMPASSCMS